MFPATGFTGKRAVGIEEACINAFSTMAEQLAPANALPAPAPVLPKSVQQAIKRKAQAMSLPHYDRLRHELTAAVERQRARFSGAPGLLVRLIVEMKQRHPRYGSHTAWKNIRWQSHCQGLCQLPTTA